MASRQDGRADGSPRRIALALALLVCCALAGPASALAATLRWAPPKLVNPIVITLGAGSTHTILSTARDYLIKLPHTRKFGGTWLEGGHNVEILGGSITIPSTSSATTAQRTAIYVKDATGTVHIEGVLIDGSGASQFDGIDIAAPQATVQLENLRIVGVNGGLNSWHADVVQPWGGVRDLAGLGYATTGYDAP